VPEATSANVVLHVSIGRGEYPHVDGDLALRADAAESLACLYLSVTVVVGQLAALVPGAWWADPAASLAIVWFLLREAREAWEAKD